MEVGVAIPVSEAGSHAVVEGATWQGRMAEAEDIVIDSRDKAGEGSDAV